MREHPVWPVLLLVASGLVWLFQGYPQLANRNAFLGDGFGRTVQPMASGNPWSFYRAFLDNVVLSHAALFSYLTLVGNVAVGVCLVVGLLTPYAALVGIFLNVNYALAAGWMTRTDYSLNGLLIVIELLIIATAAGRTAGVDALLSSAPARSRARRSW